MARAIAICEGGPLDGYRFSVQLSADGSPEPLTGREEVCGCLYVPAEPTDVPAAATGPDGEELPDPFGWADHVQAFVYRPEEVP